MKGKVVFAVCVVSLFVIVGARITSNILQIGKKVEEDITIQFDRGGATPPAIKWNETDDKIQFSNDGTVFNDLGSGSGGGGSSENINLLASSNFDFEGGAVDWTTFGGGFEVFTTVGSGSQLFGTLSGSFDGAGAGTDGLRSADVAVESGLEGTACLAELYFDNSANSSGDYVMRVELDDGTAITQDLSLGAVKSKAQIGFVCPTNDSIRMVIEDATALGSAIIIDQAYLGRDFRLTPSGRAGWYVSGALSTGAPVLGNSDDAATYQEVFNGALVLATDPGSQPATIACQSGGTGTTTCSGASEAYGWTVTIPEAALYEVCTSFTHSIDTTGVIDLEQHFKLAIVAGEDSTTITTDANAPTMAKVQGITTSDRMRRGRVMEVCETFNISAAGSTTFKMFELTDNNGGGGSINLNFLQQGAASTTAFRFSVKPVDRQVATDQVTLDNQNWRVDANIAGSNFGLSLVDQSAYLKITDNSGNMALTNNNSEVNVEIACDGAASEGTTCTGAEMMGINFDAPYAGVYRSCWTFGHRVTLNSSNEGVFAYFRQYETATNSDSNLQTGRAISQSTVSQTTSLGITDANPIYNCADFVFTSAGEKRIVVKYEQGTDNTPLSNDIVADGNATFGDRNVHVSVIPLKSNFNQAVALTGEFTWQQTADGDFTTPSTVSLTNSEADIHSVTVNESGTYLIIAHATYRDTGANEDRSTIMRLKQNTTTIAQSTQQIANTSGSQDYVQHFVSRIITLSAGDTVKTTGQLVDLASGVEARQRGISLVKMSFD